MDTPKMQVRCSVTNCIYNRDNYCYAKGLEVNAMGNGYAETSDGTACSTFICKVDNNETY